MPQQVLAAPMRPRYSAFKAEIRRLGGGNIAGSVDIEHARQNDAVNLGVHGNEPAEIVAQPGETPGRLRWPLRRQPIEAGRHMSAMAAAELPDTAVGIQRRPQRIFVVDMVGQAERDRIAGKVRYRFYE